MVLASLLVHAPLTPLFALLGLSHWLAPPDDDLDEARRSPRFRSI
jgi:hypothetical protein